MSPGAAYLPASQGVHKRLAPEPDCANPALHLHVTEPSEELLLELQPSQLSAVLEPSSVKNLPASHSVHEVEPLMSEYLPASQYVQLSAPSMSE